MVSAVFALTLVGAFAATAAQRAITVGAVAGSAGVSATGAATYSIPISVPRGSGGLTPQLALTYNSQSGSGMAGWGWTLSGFSTIARCNSAIYADGQAQAIQLTAGDDFCLDGQRLRLLPSSTTTYGTEIEGFSLITSYADSGVTGGPGHFTVQMKDGTTYEYGNTSDSRVLAQGTTVARVWGVDKITDVNGNYITFSYNQDTANGDYWPVNVSYTGNGAVAPLHVIQLDWTPLASASIQTAYVAGSLVSETQLLNKIEVKYNGADVFTYALSYQANATDNHNLLNSVQECAADGNCYNATAITWQQSQAGWQQDTSTPTTITDAAHAQAAHLMDVNGDGLMDLVYPAKVGTVDHWMVMFGVAGGGFGSAVDTGVAAVNYQYTQTLEFNGDGRGDLIYPNAGVPNADNMWHVLQSTGGSSTNNVFTDISTAIPAGLYQGDAVVADMNGHGLDDLVYSDGSTIYVAANTGGAFSAGQVLVPPSGSTQDFDIGSVTTNNQFVDSTMDFVGSGRGGRVTLDSVTTSYTCPPGSDPGCKPSSSTSYTWYALAPTGTQGSLGYSYAGSISVGTSILGWSVPAPVDMNGDGLSDLMTSIASPTGGWTDYYIYLSTGTALKEIDTEVGVYGQDPVFTDYYGNGRQAMLVDRFQGGAGWTVVSLNYDPTQHAYISQATAPGAVSAPYDGGYIQGTVHVGDTGGRGLQDLVYASNDSGTLYWHYRLHVPSTPDLVSSITDGLGNNFSPQYASLADSGGAYTEGTGASWPVMDEIPALHVVNTYSFNDGVGGTATESYAYQGLRQNMTGYPEGFSQRTATDSRNNVTATDNYDQTFPYIGMVDNAATKQSSGTPIGKTVNTYQNTQLGATGALRYFPYASQSVSTAYDIGTGSALKTVTTKNLGFDSYGDVTDQLADSHDVNGDTDFKSETVTIYTDSTSPYCISAPQHVTVTKTNPDGASMQRVTDASVGFDATHCRPTQVMVTSGTENDSSIDTSDGLSLTSQYQYDAFGNVSQTTVSGTGITTARTTTASYVNNGEYLGATTNLLHQQTNATWRSDLGFQTSATDVNGHQTINTPDGFGRMKQATRPDGTSVSWQYLTCDTSCPPVGNYMISESVQNAGATQTLSLATTAYDDKGRAVQTRNTLLGGATSYAGTVYDSLGRVLRADRPHFAGNTIYSTYYRNYDVLNRADQITQPANAGDTTNSVVTSLSYPNYSGGYVGFATVSNTATGTGTETTAKVSNALGQTAEMVDASGGTTLYSYDPFGDLVGVTAADSKSTAIAYDGLGNKVKMVDPDMGTWTYGYDALGELLTQVDAKGQKIVQTYDVLGRPSTRTDYNGTGGQTAADNWAYDTATNGIGLPASVSDNTGYQKAFSYDSLSRPSALDTTVNGTDYQVSTTYDSFGRVATLSYPVSATPAPALPVAKPVATPTQLVGGGTLTLDGSTSTDPSGDPLQFAWSVVSQPTGSNVSILNPSAKTTSVVLSQGGSYTFQLVVSDANASSTPVNVSASVVTPSSPTNVGLSPNPSNNGSYTLSWTAPGGGVGVSGYYVYESVNGGSFTNITPTGITTTSYPLSGKSNGSYKYYVIAYNSIGPGAASSTVTEAVNLPPGAPTGLGAGSSPNPSGNVNLVWTVPASGIVTGYQVYRSTGGGYTQIGTSATNSYSDNGLSDGNYWYYVIACNTAAACNSTATNTAGIQVLHYPGAPSLAVNFTVITSGGTITLSWSTPSGTVTSYKLQRYSTNTGAYTYPYTGMGTSFSQQMTVVDYVDYTVEACNNNGNDCTWSNTVEVQVQSSGGGCGKGCYAPVKAGPTASPTSSGSSSTQPAPAPTTSSPPVGVIQSLPSSFQEEGGRALVGQEPRESSHGLLHPAVTSRDISVLTALSEERQRFTPVALQPSEAEMQAAATRREEAGLPSLLPPVAASDVAAWEIARPDRAPGAPDFAPPVYIAWSGAKVKPATNPPYRFTLQYLYDASNGALTGIANQADGFIYWQAATGSGSAPVDAFGHLLAYTDGNNVSTVLSYDQATGAVTGIGSGIGQSSAVQQLTYSWDGFGNLSKRYDANQNLTENFTYDALNRVLTSSVTNPGNNGPSLSLTYDAMGDISTRSDLGAYSYGDPNHPRAVTAVAGLPGTYSYDANGNQIGGNSRTIAWNVENLPTQIQGATGTSTFSYGPGGERYSQTATDSTGTTTTTYVAGGLFEVVTNSSGTQFRHNITAGGQPVAVHTISAMGAVTTSYLHSDHLGSVDTVTNDQGVVAQRMSFDAFGKRRDAANWTYDLTAGQLTGFKGTTDKGYTDQEQLDNVGLIHMNGRVYDPQIGRMISADPTIPNPMYSQAFNRYAYVYNNPLSMTDPSGFAVTCSTKPCDKCIETCVPTPDPPPDAPPAMQPLPDVPPPARTSPVPVPSLSNVTDPNTGTHIPGVDTGCLGCSAGSFGGGNFVYGSGHVGIYGGA
ncbi:MAG TPA: RHS repeat-associated core domain-containing protein, partial [Gammaproteobacteria bacterium]|nr:RHS repeat-associated core domain-containing protein [Gammaproteobacteria bacterium]